MIYCKVLLITIFLGLLSPSYSVEEYAANLDTLENDFTSTLDIIKNLKLEKSKIILVYESLNSKISKAKKNKEPNSQNQSIQRLLKKSQVLTNKLEAMDIRISPENEKINKLRSKILKFIEGEIKVYTTGKIDKENKKDLEYFRKKRKYIIGVSPCIESI